MATTPALLHTLGVDLVGALAGPSAGAALLQAGLQLTFACNAAISVPALTADPNLAGFVTERQPIPVRPLALGSSTLLEPRKLSVIVPLTREVIEHSIPAAEILVRDALLRSVARARCRAARVPPPIRWWR